MIRADFVKALADLDKSVEGCIDFSDLIKRVDDLEVEIELRGEAMEVLYDSLGVEVARYHMVTGSECVACHVPKGMYHTCKSLQSGTVIFEFKTGKYDPEGTEEFLRK